ncbi:MAG: hypothetical protein WD601_13865 [Pseudohongiellaceae bacterium]
MDMLTYRHHLIAELLGLYREVDQTPSDDPDRRLALHQRIDRCLRDLSWIENELTKIGAEFSWQPEDQPASGETNLTFIRHAHETPFNKATLARLMEQSGLGEAQRERQRSSGRWWGYRQRLLTKLVDMEPLTRHRTTLDDNNPFFWWHDHVLRHLFIQPHGEHYSSVQTYIDHINTHLNDYLTQAQPSGAALPNVLPLYEHDDLIDRWVAWERQRLEQQGGAAANESLAQLIESRFCQNAGKALWLQMNANAEALDNTADYLSQLDERDRVYRNPTLATGRLAEEDTGSINVQGVRPRAVRPRFINPDTDQPYRNTQVLCWRYNPSEPDELGNMRLDDQLSHLYTVGILYLDDEGYPTPLKPAFLQKR